MRSSSAIALALLIRTVPLFAQPVVSEEIHSDPIPKQNAVFKLIAPAVSLAKDASGLAFAWTMPNARGRDSVFVGRLNASGHAMGAAIEVPVFTNADLVEASYPSIAAKPDGSGFVVTWFERSPFANYAFVFTTLDAGMKPSAPRLLTFQFAAPSSPPIVRSGARTWIAASKVVWELRGDDSLAFFDGGFYASDMTIWRDLPQLAGNEPLAALAGCTCPVGGGLFKICPRGCELYRYSSHFHFISLFEAYSELTLPIDNLSQPAIESDGRDELMAWFDNAQSSGGFVVASKFPPSRIAAENARRIGSFGANTQPTRPDIAWNGDRFVVVWQTKNFNGDHDIAGASIDDAGNITQLSIAASSADERDPSIIATDDGTFLIAYETFSGDQRRIAGRFLSFGGRRRSIR